MTAPFFPADEFIGRPTGRAHAPFFVPTFSGSQHEFRNSFGLLFIEICNRFCVDRLFLFALGEVGNHFFKGHRCPCNCRQLCFGVAFPFRTMAHAALIFIKSRPFSAAHNKIGVAASSATAIRIHIPFIRFCSFIQIYNKPGTISKSTPVEYFRTWNTSPDNEFMPHAGDLCNLFFKSTQADRLLQVFSKKAELPFMKHKIALEFWCQAPINWCLTLEFLHFSRRRSRGKAFRGRFKVQIGG